TADGSVLMPSFHRPWLQSLRAFPGNGDELDVKNLIGSPGYWYKGKYQNNDSVWLDVGFPVQTAPDGRKYKPLFAPLIMDLDNRVNISVAGNIMGSKQGTQQRHHVSAQGWGRWEVNPARVLNVDIDPN